MAPNPPVQPPLEDCERGIYAMRRYCRCLGDHVPSSGDIAKPLLGSARHAMGATGCQSTPGHFMRHFGSVFDIYVSDCNDGLLSSRWHVRNKAGSLSTT